MNYEDDYYERRREYYLDLDRRDEYREQDWREEERRREDIDRDLQDYFDRKEDEKYERERLEKSLEEDRDLMRTHPDAGRLLKIKYGFDEDRLLDNILHRTVQPFSTGSDEFEFQVLKFYESGPDTPEVSQRRYSEHFKKSSSRYINFEVNLKNMLWKVREHKHKITGKYYRPDGSLFGATEYQAVVKPDWQNSWHTKGWGWTEPGHWKNGTYRVEILIDGKKVTEGHFTIYEDVRLNFDIFEDLLTKEKKAKA